MSDGEVFKEISKMKMLSTFWQASTSYVSVSV